MFHKMKYIMFLLLLNILVISTACSIFEEKTIIPIATDKQDTSFLEGNVKNKETLKFAILSNVSIKETYRTHYNLVKLVEERLGQPVEIIQKKTYAEIIELFDAGEVDLGFVCGYLSVLGDEKGIMNKLVMPIVNGQKQYTSYIITRNDVEINFIDDLYGKSFAFSDPSSFSGYLVPKHLIKTEGYEFDTFFSNTFFTYSHDHSVAAVVNGLVDATAVYSTSFEKLKSEGNPLVKETKVIAQGPYVGNPPIVVNPKIAEEQRQLLKEIFLTMHESEEGKTALEQLNYDFFVEVDEKLYTPILLMIEDLEIGND